MRGNQESFFSKEGRRGVVVIDRYKEVREREGGRERKREREKGERVGWGGEKSRNWAKIVTEVEKISVLDFHE